MKLMQVVIKFSPFSPNTRGSCRNQLANDYRGDRHPLLMTSPEIFWRARFCKTLRHLLKIARYTTECEDLRVTLRLLSLISLLAPRLSPWTELAPLQAAAGQDRSRQERITNECAVPGTRNTWLYRNWRLRWKKNVLKYRTSVIQYILHK